MIVFSVWPSGWVISTNYHELSWPFERAFTAHANPHATPCHAMHRARALSTKMNNDRADGHSYSFDWIRRSWMFGDPYFSFQKQISFTIISILSKNEQKNQCGKFKKFEDFCPRDIESCHLAAARRVKLWSLNANLVFEEPHQLTKFN